MWNLEKQYWQSYWQGSKGDTGIFDTEGKGEGWIIWANGIETYTLPYVKQTASGNLLYGTGNPNPVLCDNPEGWDGEG